MQTAVWGELGKFVWHEALKLTKDCRAWAGIDKARGAGRGRSEPFLTSPCSLNIPAVSDGCSGRGESSTDSILRGVAFICLDADLAPLLREVLGFGDAFSAAWSHGRRLEQDEL